MAKVAPPAFIEPPPRWYTADPTQDDPVGRDSRERHMLATLDNRVAWCREQVEGGRCSEGAANHYRAEMASLRWALGRIAELERLERTQ